MAVHFSHAALPYPIKNARWTVEVPYLDADGDPTDPTTPDTELSKDGAAFADCAEEVSTISGSNGVGYITLSGAETNCSMAALVAKVASGPKATVIPFVPRVLALIGSGTLSAGSAGGGTLGTLLAYDVTGCFIRTTGGTGGGGTGGANNQARKIATYNTGSGAFTVVPDWETTPSTDTTYDVLLPEGVTLGMLRTLNPTTAGRTLDVTATGAAGIDWANVENPTTAVNLSATNIDPDQVVASVTGNVGGNVGGSVGSVTAGVTLADGAHGGTSAVITLGQLRINSSDVDGAIYVTNSVGNGVQVTVTGAGGTAVDFMSTGGTPSAIQFADANGNAIDGEGIVAFDSQVILGTNVSTSANSIPWNAAWDTEVQSEVQDAIEANNLDHIAGTATGIPSIPAGTYIDQMMDDGTAVYDRTTDSLQAIRDRGDAAWTTATGFSTLTQTQVTGGAYALNSASFAFNAALSLTTQQKADVNAEVLDVINVDTFAEPGQEAPAATNTIRKMLQFLFKAWRNKSTETATEYKLFADDGTTVDQKSTNSDDGTTFTSGEVGTGP